MSIAALAMSVAGSLAQAQGQKQAQKAMRNAQNAESARQDTYQKEGMGYWQGALDRSGRPTQDTKLTEATDKRGDAYNANVKDFDVNTDLLAGMQSSPDVVKNTVASNTQSSIDDQKLEGLRKAFLDAWGDNQLATASANQRSGDSIGMIGRFAQGSAGVLPLELQAAQSKGQGMRSLGSVLQAAGMVTGMAGGAGGLGDSLFGADAPTSLGKVAAQNGIGPWTYSPPVPGMPGSQIYSIPLP